MRNICFLFSLSNHVGVCIGRKYLILSHKFCSFSILLFFVEEAARVIYGHRLAAVYKKETWKENNEIQLLALIAKQPGNQQICGKKGRKVL